MQTGDNMNKTKTHIENRKSFKGEMCVSQYFQV